MTEAWKANGKVPIKNNLIAPSISSGWTPDDIWNTNFVETYTDVLSMISMEQCVTPKFLLHRLNSFSFTCAPQLP